MRCDEVRVLVSAAADGELLAGERAVLDSELARCPDCRLFAARVARLRSQLRFEALNAEPDLAPAVLERVAARQPTHLDRRDTGRARSAPPRSRVPLVAALIAGIVAGATFVGIAREPQSPTAAFDVSAAVLEAQAAVSTLAADLYVTERDWAPAVPLRTYRGTIRYSSPESLAVDLHDVTLYRSDRWVPNDVTHVVDGERTWTRSVRACPRESLPGCQVRQPVVQAVEGREPFADATPMALDLIVPVSSFLLASSPQPAVTGTIGGREAVRVDATVAQTRPLLDGVLAAGAWRDLAPSDRVELWLDAAAMVPLRVSVLPADSPERAEWAARRGYDDRPGVPVLEIELRDVRLDTTVGPEAFPPPPETADIRDAGFTSDSAVASRLTPAALPPDMQLVRAGRVVAAGAPPVEVAAWSDGRAWLSVRASDGWTGDRLFGDLGDVVRRLDLGDAGVVYTDESGTRVALHGDREDLVVTGSLSEPRLVDVAASLGVTGRPVPAHWPEAATMSIAELRRQVPDVLLPANLEGFGPPAARVRGRAAVLAYAGPGDRGFELVVAPGTGIGPPLDVDAREVSVRDRPARWNPGLGTLEWVEGTSTVSLSSETLTLDELVTIASGLEPGLEPG